MIRRLCLFLLMACLALPAMAAPLHCAPEPAPVVETSGHRGHHEERKAPAERMAQHDCIGCIAPFSAPDAGGEVDLVTPSDPKPHIELLLARLTSGPDTPPPRA